MDDDTRISGGDGWTAFAGPLLRGALGSLPAEIRSVLQPHVGEETSFAEVFTRGAGISEPHRLPSRSEAAELEVSAGRGAAGFPASDVAAVRRIVESLESEPEPSRRARRLAEALHLVLTDLLRDSGLFATVARIAAGRRPTAHHLVPGASFADRYVLKSILGEGGFATVWRVEHADLHEELALKVFKRGVCSDAEAEKRFLREIATTKSFVHKNAVQLRDAGRDAVHGLYYVMDLVDGRTLRAELDAARRMPLERVVAIGIQVLAVLGEAHSAGIVHRDLKPGNLMLTRTRSGEQVRVLDFGLAKAKHALGAAPSGSSEITEPGQVVGTPLYMSPEQALGHEVDARSDLYSLAVVLFEALSGRLPIELHGRTVAALESFFRRLSAETPASLETVAPGVSPAVSGVLARALAKDPNARWQSATEFAVALSAAAGGEASGRPGSSVGVSALVATGVGPQPAPPRPPLAAVGWAGERLPRGLTRGSEPPLYVHDRGRGVSIEMVYVPPGRFTMGTDAADADASDRPSHPQEVPHGVWIARTPVTWRGYLAFCAATGRARPPEPPFEYGDDHPVVNVSWDDARAFCEWLDLGLPTEIEREKAARGTNGREYPWGSERPAPALCVSREDPFYGDRSTAPVSARPRGASPYGALDLAGNVTEWCADAFVPDLNERLARGEAPVVELPPGSLRSIRGGAFCMSAASCRSSHRSGAEPEGRFYVGFRPVCRAETP